jgi:hypothetical protein
MARPTKAVSTATRPLGQAPNFGVSGGMGAAAVGYDTFTNLLPEMFGVDLIRDMMIMWKTDETVGAMAYAIWATMRQIKWEYEPQIDGVAAPDDPEAKKWADLAQSMLKDMDRPFDDHVTDAMTMLPAGFAAIEIVMKQRDGVNSRFNDRYYGIDTLNLLDQTTIWDFLYENQRPVAMKQFGYSRIGDGVIPLDKTLLYRVNAQYNNPRGQPLLRNAWRPWRLKRKIQDSEALGIERELCGLPIFEMPEEVILAQFDTNEAGDPTEEALQAQRMVAAAKEATQDMRLNKTGGMVIPSDPWGEDSEGSGSAQRKYNFRILTSAGTRAIDSRTAARDYDHAIARVCMMQFLTLGQRSGGSYALSDDQSSMAVSSIMALADGITSEWNMKAVPMIWRVNLLPDKYRPRLKHSEVNKNGIVQIGQFFSGVAKAASLWGGDAKARRAILGLANIPYDAAAQDEAANTHREAAEMAAEPPEPQAPAAPGAAAEDEED